MGAGRIMRLQTILSLNETKSIKLEPRFLYGISGTISASRKTGVLK